MESILSHIESFLGELPPLLQLLAGVFAALAVMKIVVLAANFFEKNKSED